MFYGGLLEAVEIANAMKTTKGTIEGYLNRIRKKWSRLRNVVG
jgi:DNA-directed RNA polymerase specialized sigma24 family protein